MLKSSASLELKIKRKKKEMQTNDEINQPRLTNRERARKPHKSLAWCGNCDCCRVSAGSVCRQCGSRADGNEARKRDIKIFE